MNALEQAKAALEEVVDAYEHGVVNDVVIAKVCYALAALSQLVEPDRNAVIEECAKVCDERADMHKYGVVWSSQRGEEADNCASSIRKLKTTSDAARKESK